MFCLCLSVFFLAYSESLERFHTVSAIRVKFMLKTPICDLMDGLKRSNPSSVTTKNQHIAPGLLIYFLVRRRRMGKRQQLPSCYSFCGKKKLRNSTALVDTSLFSARTLVTTILNTTPVFCLCKKNHCGAFITFIYPCGGGMCVCVHAAV